jgi:hypothetical protein
LFPEPWSKYRFIDAIDGSPRLTGTSACVRDVFFALGDSQRMPLDPNWQHTTARRGQKVSKYLDVNLY